MVDYAEWAAASQLFAAVEVYTSVPLDNHLGAEHFERPGVAIHRFKSRRIGTKFELVSPYYFVRVLHRIRSAKTQVVVHFWELRGLVPLLALLLKILYPTRVHLVHSAFGQLHPKGSALRSIYDFLFLPTFCRSIDLALVQNRHEFEVYETLLLRHGAARGKARNLPLHVTSEWRQCVPDKSGEQRFALRERHGIPSDARIIIFLGRFNRAKGLERLLDVFARLAAESPHHWILLLVGSDDGWQIRLTQAVDQHPYHKSIRIITGVQEERFDFYRLADIFCAFPVIQEETMLASLEALSAGTPVLVSTEADIPYVEDRGAGAVIAFDEARAVTAIQQIVSDRQAMGKRAREVIRDCFESSTVRAQFLGLVKSVLNANPRAGRSVSGTPAAGSELDSLPEGPRLQPDVRPQGCISRTLRVSPV